MSQQPPSIAHELPSRGQGIEFATVDGWWALTEQYPVFRRVTGTALKDFGYMRIANDLRRLGLKRVLEFGCGLAMVEGQCLADLFPEGEVWAVDDWQNLHYYPAEEVWVEQFKALNRKYPQIKFTRGLLGHASSLETLPTGYFDAIVSVSVLEEIPQFYQPVFEHAHRLLRDGGYFLATSDFCVTPQPAYPWPNNLNLCVETQRSTGFELPADFQIPSAAGDLLLENCTVTMLYYQGSDGPDRKFWGHFGTMYTAAQKNPKPNP